MRQSFADQHVLGGPLVAEDSHHLWDQIRRVARSKTGFTLVELLVVIAIISILAGMLLPALQSATQAAYDIRCLNTMRQCLVAVSIYNSEDAQSLSNNVILPKPCAYWNKGWMPWGGGHSTLNDESGYHQYTELRSGFSSWRGALLRSGIAESDILGCSRPTHLPPLRG